MITLTLLLPMMLLARGSGLGRIESSPAKFATEWNNWPILDVVEADEPTLDLAERNGDPRVVGGEDAADDAVNFQVSLQWDKWQHFCGGSIINKRWILTAAHCLFRRPKWRVTVVMGITRLSKSAKGVRRKCADFKIHEKYNSVSLQNDIGGIKMDYEIEFTVSIGPIDLATQNPADGQTACVMGWGYSSYPEIKVPDHLQELCQKIVEFLTCKAALKKMGIPGNSIQEGYQLCALSDDKKGHGACMGDSGGPLVLKGTEGGNATVQIGILSFWNPCAKGDPDAYTSVSNYRPWIDKNLI